MRVLSSVLVGVENPTLEVYNLHDLDLENIRLVRKVTIRKDTTKLSLLRKECYFLQSTKVEVSLIIALTSAISHVHNNLTLSHSLSYESIYNQLAITREDINRNQILKSSYILHDYIICEFCLSLCESKLIQIEDLNHL